MGKTREKVLGTMGNEGFVQTFSALQLYEGEEQWRKDTGEGLGKATERGNMQGRTEEKRFGYRQSGTV